MKLVRLIAAALITASVSAPLVAQDSIKEFRIGILGGENASDRLRSNECLRARTEELLGVPTKLFAPADYNGVIEGLLGGNLDMAWLGASGYAKTYLTDPDAVEPVLVKINTDGSVSGGPPDFVNHVRPATPSCALRYEANSVAQQRSTAWPPAATLQISFLSQIFHAESG